MTRWLVVGACFVAVWLAFLDPAPRAYGCAFSVNPTTYDPPINRSTHLKGMELAGFNMIAPQSSYFGIPNVETGLRQVRQTSANPFVPPTLLKAIGYIESGIRNSTSSSSYASPHFGGVGPALQSFDCGYGIMQITSGMTSPLDSGWPSENQSLVATHYLYNIGRGSAILVDKWNAAPSDRPIAGTDTHSDPTIVENWYFATWSYNGFTGPFAAVRSNHPASPSYDWPRTGFSCGALNDGFGHSYGDYPYQELVFGCAKRPPSVNNQILWPSLSLSLPNLEDDRWGEPLSLETWSDCVSAPIAACPNYNLMDMPSPAPTHLDPVGRPSNQAAADAHGAPVLSVSHTHVDQLDTTITIRNVGEGILSWRADHEQTWFAINKQAGVALGDDVTCTQGVPCSRNATLRITIAPELAPRNGSYGWVNIISLTTGQLWQVGVVPPNSNPGATATPTRTNTPRGTSTPSPRFPAGDANCSTAANSIDASLILQYGAGLVTSLPCPGAADANQDGTTNVLDAQVILQYTSGLIPALPP
jgi:hypothetical protein